MPAATMYRVERATDASFTANVTDFVVNSPTATAYSDISVASGTTYYYRVRAENAAAYSTWTTAPSPAVVP
jgi:hypothetical protein